MRVLIVGSGAREHALAWAVARSPRLETVWTAPGNGGTATLSGGNIALDPMDGAAIAAAARERGADLVIVGPDDPLAAGVVDALQAAGVRAFGPTRAAAQIEASKAWAKEFMTRRGIPTAPFAVFDEPGTAHAYADRRSGQLVVKADGLARGKGVLVCDTRQEVHAAIEQVMEQRTFGTAGARVVLEERLSGEEVSVFALCDGEHAVPFQAARDHKRLLDGDRGPNTGGMGAYSPSTLAPPALMDDVMARIVRPAVQGMAREGRPFVGLLYAGLMLTDAGPQVIEFNARFGDPEAQAILPRLESDLLDAIEAASEGCVETTALRWSNQSTCAVCLASAGYPERVQDGVPIKGLAAAGQAALVFHAGTVCPPDGQVLTKGGRVLTVVGQGATLAAARSVAYGAVERLRFDGMQYRRDIGARELHYQAPHHPEPARLPPASEG